MKEATLVEIVFPAAELLKVGLERDEIEDRLVEALGPRSLGKVSGAGRGSGVVALDVELDSDRIEDGLAVVVAVLEDVDAPDETRLLVRGDTPRLIRLKEATTR